MRYNSSGNTNKVIIRCGHCLSKLRVPLDRGKISVSCPTCRNRFIYNPKSILDSLRQINIMILAKLPSKLRNPVIPPIIIAAVLLVLSLIVFYLTHR